MCRRGWQSGIGEIGKIPIGIGTGRLQPATLRRDQGVVLGASFF